MKKVTWVSIAAAAGVLVLAIGATWFARTRGDAPDEWRTLPVYRALERHEPAAYARLLERYEDSRRGRITAAQFINAVNEIVNEAATRRLPRASTEAKLALLRDLVANLGKLRARNDDGCFRYLYPEIAGGADVAA